MYDGMCCASVDVEDAGRGSGCGNGLVSSCISKVVFRSSNLKHRRILGHSGYEALQIEHRSSRTSVVNVSVIRLKVDGHIQTGQELQHTFK